jgi:hypothetical protein
LKTRRCLLDERGSGTEEEDDTKWEEPPEEEENKDDDDELEGEAITEDDTLKVVAYFAHLQDNEDYIHSNANKERVSKFAWMIERLKLDIRNYNSIIELTRKEADDTIAKYKACLGQNNWRMQKNLDTNLTVRRQEDSRRHSQSFATRQEAEMNKLKFVPWWKDDTQPDEYHGGTPQMPLLNEKTLQQHVDFVNERKSQARSSGARLERVTQMVVDGYKLDEQHAGARRGRSPMEDRQTRRNRSQTRGMAAQSSGGQTMNVRDMRITDEKFTQDWTKENEAEWLDPAKTMRGRRNAENWMQLTPGMKNMVRMTYRTAVGKPITNLEEQAAHFGSHFKHWQALFNTHQVESDEYWRIAQTIHECGLGSINTKPCRYYAEGRHCKNGYNCRHLHVREKSVGAGGGGDDRGIRRRRD